MLKIIIIDNIFLLSAFSVCVFTDASGIVAVKIAKYCYIVIYIIIQHHNDTIPKTDA